MMKAKIVRKIDKLGRIVLPQEYMSALFWTAGIKVAISKDGDKLILQAYKDSCFLCGSEEGVLPIKNKHICSNCIEEIKRVNNENSIGFKK